MAETNGITIPIPTTIAAIITALVKLGPITAIACYLVYVGAQTLPNMADDIRLQRAAIEKQSELTQRIVSEHEEINQSIIRLCIVYAVKNQVDINNCYEKKPQ